MLLIICCCTGHDNNKTYDNKIFHPYIFPTCQVHSSLAEARRDCGRLKQERDLFEENMKKAFMRGVCALNMEAMSMFKTTHDRYGWVQCVTPFLHAVSRCVCTISKRSVADPGILEI